MMDLGPSLEGPTFDPDLARRLAERDERMRVAAQTYIDRVAAGDEADPEHLAWAEHTVRRLKPLAGPMGTGEPA